MIGFKLFILLLIFRWFCHIDDDMYINIPLLVSTLQKYNPFQEFRYIGRHPWPPNTMRRFKYALPKKLRPVSFFTFEI